MKSGHLVHYTKPVTHQLLSAHRTLADWIVMFLLTIM